MCPGGNRAYKRSSAAYRSRDAQHLLSRSALRAYAQGSAELHLSPGTGADFVEPEARSRFLAAALIAGDLWNSRIYADRLSGELNIDEARKRALGVFRKAIDESNSPSHLGSASAAAAPCLENIYPASCRSSRRFSKPTPACPTNNMPSRRWPWRPTRSPDEPKGCVFNPKTVGATTRSSPRSIPSCGRYRRLPTNSDSLSAIPLRPRDTVRSATGHPEPRRRARGRPRRANFLRENRSRAALSRSERHPKTEARRGHSRVRRLWRRVRALR